MIGDALSILLWGVIIAVAIVGAVTLIRWEK